MLCASGFIDDVTLSRNGPCGDSGVAILGSTLVMLSGLGATDEKW